MRKLIILLPLIALGCATEPGLSKREMAANTLAIDCGGFCETVRSGKLAYDTDLLYMADGKIRLKCECVRPQATPETTEVHSVNPSAILAPNGPTGEAL